MKRNHWKRQTRILGLAFCLALLCGCGRMQNYSNGQTSSNNGEQVQQPSGQTQQPDGNTGTNGNANTDGNAGSNGSSTNQAQQPSSDSAITEEQARQLVLDRIPGAASENIVKFEQEYDDGRLEYEGEILYNGMEYEFEIDAASGTIRSWEEEPAGH